jgi:hypothetical protein
LIRSINYSFFIIIVLFLSTAFAMENSFSDDSILLQLLEEAAALQAEQPQQWQAYLKKAEEVFEENARERAGWRKRGVPPLPDLRTLKLPLAFLATELQRKDTGNYPRAYGYLTAISAHPDRRRIAVLTTYFRNFKENEISDSHYKLLADAVDLEWASEQVPLLLAKEKWLSTGSQLYFILYRFAGELPQEQRAACYDHIRHYWPKGPTNGDGERYWELLVRLEPKRARHEIIPYFKEYDSDLYVVRILEENPYSSEEIAAVVREWLAKINRRDYELMGDNLRALLLISAPDKELNPTLKYIDSVIVKLKKSSLKNLRELEEEANYLIEAILKLDLDSAVETLAGYVHNQEIDDLLRLDIIRWLVKRRYERLPEIVARWLTEEDEYRQKWLRAAAKEEWGEYGKSIMGEAEKLILKKNRKRF